MANIPVLPLQNPGDLNYQTNLNQTLLNNFSDNGCVMPSQTSANITEVAPEMPDGTVWYDTSIHALRVKSNGIVETIATL